MTKKITLDARTEPLLSILGISCHLPDYRLSFLLNQSLRTSFRKTEDFQGLYSLYTFRDEETRIMYYLLGNQSEEKVLFPEIRQTDFILILEGPVKKASLSKLATLIRSIANVLAVFELDLKTIKNYQAFLTDLEMHFLNLKRTNVPK